MWRPGAVVEGWIGVSLGGMVEGMDVGGFGAGMKWIDDVLFCGLWG